MTTAEVERSVKVKRSDRERPPKAAGKIATIALFGSFVPPALAAARSFRDAGIKVATLGIGSGQPRLWSNAITFTAFMRPDEVGTPAGISVINNFIQQTNAQVLLPIWEPHMLWLAANQDSLLSGCKLLVPNIEAVQAVQSKRYQLRVAERCGFNALPTWELSTSSEVRRIDPAAYPICLRPSDPRQVDPFFKVDVLRSPEELQAFLDRRSWGPEPLLAQPFRSLPNVVIHGVRNQSGRLLALEGFIVPMKFEGVALEVRPWRVDQQVAECCRKFVEELQITGPFHFELLYSAESNTFYYLEINARMGGSTDKVFRLGFDEPLLALAAFGFDVPVRPYCPAGDRPAINRRTLLKHIAWALQGRLSPLDYPGAGTIRHLLLSLRGLLWAKDSIASLRDLRGTRWYYIRKPDSKRLWAPRIRSIRGGPGPWD